MSIYKEEYREELVNEHFTVEDFGWENIDHIKYIHESYPQYSRMRLFLKQTGEKQVEEAINHVEKLEFVSCACECWNMLD